jgi:hypothetical protein
MYNPLRDGDGKVKDALILRRYKPPTQPDESDAWTVPDDRKVNAWDLNELDPTDNGTMGTIPGPVIECNVGDSVVVHFRNLDMRTRLVSKEVCFDLPFIGKICFPSPEPIEIEAGRPHPRLSRAQTVPMLSPPDALNVAGASGRQVTFGRAGVSGTQERRPRAPGRTFIAEHDRLALYVQRLALPRSLDLRHGERRTRSDRDHRHP